MPEEQKPKAQQPTDRDLIAAGDHDVLARRYYQRLRHYVYQRLNKRFRRVAGSSAANSALAHFFLEVGNDPGQLMGHDAWGLLVTIAQRRIARRVRTQTQSKRDTRKTESIGERTFDKPLPSLDEVATVEEIQRSIDALPETDDEIGKLHRELKFVAAEHWYGGKTQKQVAEELGISEDSVARRWALLRKSISLWNDVCPNCEAELKDRSTSSCPDCSHRWSTSAAQLAQRLAAVELED